MAIKPLYLLADSQLFFGKSGSDSLAERLRADLVDAHDEENDWWDLRSG